MTNKQQTSFFVKDDLSLNDYIHFASIGRPHGLKGAFFLKTSDRRKVWDQYKVLLIETHSGFQEKKVLKHYLSGNALVLELEGLSSRSKIEELYNKKIYVHKNEIHLEKDDYLVNDLLSFKVVTNEKGIIGCVVGIVSYGAQDNLEIEIEQSKKRVLYPFIEKYILHIDYEKKQIQVFYLEAFLEE